MKKATLFIVACLVSLFTQLHAQNSVPNANDVNESAQLLRQNGQIYLVVLVLVTIFAGIIFMLIRIERKLHRLEKQIKH